MIFVIKAQTSMFMRLRVLPMILLAPVLLFSCKKDNAVINNSNTSGGSNNNNVV